MEHEDTGGTDRQNDSQYPTRPATITKPSFTTTHRTCTRDPSRPFNSLNRPVRGDTCESVRHVATHHALVHSCTAAKKHPHHLNVAITTRSMQWCVSIRLSKHREPRCTTHTHSRVSHGARRHRWRRQSDSQYPTQSPAITSPSFTTTRTRSQKLVIERTRQTRYSVAYNRLFAHGKCQRTFAWFTAAPPTRSAFTTSTCPASLAACSGVHPSV